MKLKEEYVEMLHRQIDDWDNRISLLQDRLKIVEGESRTELQDQIDSLTQKREEIAGKVKTVQQASADAWEDIKAGLELASDAVQSSLESAFSRFMK